MNDDIRILRDALKRYRDFVEVPDGDPMEVPLYWYNSAKSTYAEACDPDRIRRLLDDAERYQTIKEHADVIFHAQQRFKTQEGLTIESTMPTSEELDRATDSVRKA